MFKKQFTHLVTLVPIHVSTKAFSFTTLALTFK